MIVAYNMIENEASFRPKKRIVQLILGVKDYPIVPTQSRRRSIFGLMPKQNWQKPAEFHDYVRFESSFICSLFGLENLLLYFNAATPVEMADTEKLLARDDIRHNKLIARSTLILKERWSGTVVIRPQTQEALTATREAVWWDETFWGIIGGQWTLETPFLAESECVGEHWFLEYIDRFSAFLSFWTEAPVLDVWTVSMTAADLEARVLETAKRMSMETVRVGELRQG